MSSVLPTITIDLVLDRNTTRDVLRGVLHAILFHRLFGTIKAQTFEVLDVTMPGVADPDTEQLVNEKVDAFWKGIEGGASKRGQIIVTMSERKTKKSWFYTGEEDVPWEQWVINAELRQPKSTLDRTFNRTITATLVKTVQTLVTYISSERGRSVVPPITDAAGISPFPFTVVVKIGNQEILQDDLMRGSTSLGPCPVCDVSCQSGVSVADVPEDIAYPAPRLVSTIPWPDRQRNFLISYIDTPFSALPNSALSPGHNSRRID